MSCKPYKTAMVSVATSLTIALALALGRSQAQTGEQGANPGSGADPAPAPAIEQPAVPAQLTFEFSPEGSAAVLSNLGTGFTY